MSDPVDPSKLVDPSCEVLGDEAFRHVLARETSRATRYQDFFSVCLVRPDPPDPGNGSNDGIRQAVSQKIAESLRSTDVVGRLHEGIAILLLHTASAEALRVAERIRAHIENVAFPSGPGGTPRRLTLSVGEVSFPRDGYNDKVLLSRAQALLEEAARRGGNQVAHAGESEG